MNMACMYCCDPQGQRAAPRIWARGCYLTGYSTKQGHGEQKVDDNRQKIDCFLLIYTIVTLFQLYHGGNMMYEVRRKPEADFS